MRRHVPLPVRLPLRPWPRDIAAGRRLLRPPALVAALLVLAASIAATPAAAQSRGDLRRENERLRQEKVELEARVARLEAALAEARAEAKALQDRMAELEERVQAAGDPGASRPAVPNADPANRGAERPGAGEPDGPEAVVTVDETEPDASPRAVRAEARRRWEAGPGRLDRGRDASSPARINYLRALETWAREQERALRMEIRWIVRPVEAPREEAVGTVWRMRAHDPVTDVPLGRPFDVRVRTATMRTLERALAARETPGSSPPTAGPALELRGRLVVRLPVDPRRGTPGPFDRPPLLAPFVAMELGVDAIRLLPAPRTPEAPERSRGGGGHADADADEEREDGEPPADTDADGDGAATDDDPGGAAARPHDGGDHGPAAAAG